MKHPVGIAFRSLVGAGLLLAGQTALAGGDCGGDCPPMGKIGDFLWEDCNGNGIQDDSSARCEFGGGIPDASVILREPANPQDGACSVIVGGKELYGAIIDESATDSSGNYLFTDLSAGGYCVQFPKTSCPDGSQRVFTTKNAPGSDASNDSDAFASGIASVYLPEGDTNETIDAGVLCYVAIADTLWEDLNRDGIQDDLNLAGGEPGINGVTVTLLDCEGNPIGDSTTTGPAPADAEFPQVPGGAGWYQFADLLPGCYQVAFDKPAEDYVFTLANQDDPGTDSNVNPNGVTGQIDLISGDSDPTIDAGVYLAPAGLGDFVFEDLDADGIQDENDPGIPNVLVKLLSPGPDGDCNTSDDAATGLGTTTDAMGAYGFEGLDPGRYCVVFDKTGVDCAFGDPSFSPQGQGDPAADSDPDPDTGVSSNVDLAAGEFDPTIDAGIYCPAALGDRVWNDLNGDGLQDCSDTNNSGIIGDVVGGQPDTGLECDQAAVPGVEVRLFDRVNGQCITEPELASATTDPQGFYEFLGLAPGIDYCVQWDRPTDTECTVPNVGDDPAVDSDGVQTNGTCQTDEPIVLESNEFDPNWDLGLVETPPECDLQLDKQCRVETPPAPVFTEKCDGKIQEFTVTWPEDQPAVTVTLGTGLTGSSIGQSGTVQPGQNVTFFGDGSTNDVFIDISGAVSGPSKFHLSCSDKDMDADTESNEAQPQVSDAGQDCGKFQGNAKDNDKDEFVNLWLLAGLVDKEGKELVCTPPEPGPFADSCEFERRLVSCETSGKPDAFTFRYLGEGPVSECTDNAASRAGEKVPTCSGNLPAGAEVMISAKADLSKTTVAPGETFELSGFGSNTELTLSGGGGTEVDEFHTSCSAPLEAGDIFGNLELVAFDGQRSSATVAYQYEVTNLGDQVSDIAITDDKVGPVGTVDDLEGGASRTLTAVAEIFETTTNTAMALGTLSNGDQCAAPQDSVTVTAVAPTCDVGIRLDKVEDNKIKWRLDNPSDVDATIETVRASWPGADVDLKKVKFDGNDILKNVLMMSPVEITSDEWQKKVKDRTLKAGDDNKEFKLEFDAKFPLKKDQPPSDFELEVTFEQGCSVTF